jgi:hypothetical protein
MAAGESERGAGAALLARPLARARRPGGELVTRSASFTRSFLARYRRIYNTLLDVDVAYARLRRNRRQLRAIRAALRVIAEHRANRFVGVTLLHRHFRAAPNAVFVERRFTPAARRHRTLLVTSPMPAAVAPRRLAPHRLAFTRGGALEPLEFTTDPAAIRAYRRIAEDERLRTEVAGILAESGAGSLLGLGIFARAPSVARATSVFLEETRFAERQSVVHVLPRLPRAPGRLIPTQWTWGSGGELVCETLCRAYCSHPKVGIGYCGHGKDRHVGKT